MPAGAGGIRFQRPDFQVWFWEVDDYVLGYLLFLGKKIQEKRFLVAVLKDGSMVYMVKGVRMYVWADRG